MAMALLPALAPESSVSGDYAAAIGARMAKGERPMDIARKLHPHDSKARLRTYMKIRRLALKDQRVLERINEDLQIEMMVGLVPATQALVTRASRGRPDAIKLLYEASGFHNPRVKHDHSGEIQIKLVMPRPKFDADATVADAEVVD
jgi:hypothetical protein